MSGHCSLVVTCWEWAALLVLLYVMLYCVLSLSHMVSWIRLESVVAQWLVHLPLVLEVPGSIPARGEENFGVRTRLL